LILGDGDLRDGRVRSVRQHLAQAERPAIVLTIALSMRG
jgi:hypothetical protein